MHQFKLLLLSLTLLLVACSQQAETSNQEQPEQATSTDTVVVEQTETERLNVWLEAKYEEELMQSPIQLTFQGRKERYGEVDDVSEEAELKNIQWKVDSAAEMKSAFDYDKLSDNAKLSYDLWVYQADRAAASIPFVRRGYIFEQMNGVHATLPTILISFHKVESLEDMQAYVSRIGEMGRAMNQLIERAKVNAQEGVRPPRFAYEIVRKEVKDIIGGKPFADAEEESSLWTSVNSNLSSLLESGAITAEQADELKEQARVALLEKFQPSYQSLIEFIDEDMENTTELAQGVHALPDGDAYYNYRLKEMTTLDISAKEIHDLGLAEVARLRGEMEAIKDKVGYEGTLKEFFTYIRDSKDNEQFYYPNTDEGRQGYIDDATAAIENLKAVLPDYFGIMPKADLVVKRVESFREQDGAPQHYYPSTPDGSRPGVYYAHLSDMESMPKNELEVIAYHEGLPGHHMQIAIAQELEGVPTFRRQANFTAYAEGWGLYSEALAKEMPGTFTDPYSDFGRLGSEIWRAIRLVVDTGMHEMKWSQQQAVDYFVANSPAAQGQIEAEIRRYLVIPGQATAYKVGMIHIQNLRKKAKEELGEKFDIRGFHDAVLDGGSMPLSMLTRKVDLWIASQKEAPTG